MGDKLYGRRYRILVSNNQGTALDVSKLRCTFSVSKTMMMQPNISEVNIYNLSANSENSLISEGSRIIIEAGYEGAQYGLIFDGDVIQPIRDKEEGTTYKLTLTSLDGDRFMNYGFVNYAFNKGMSKRKAIEECVNISAMPTELGFISDSMENSELTRGKVVFGLAKDYLRQIARSEKATFYVDDGKVNIVRAEDIPEGQTIELNPASGLIGVPTQTEFGVYVKCLLNPRIKLNSMVHIDNSLIRERQIEIGQITRSLDVDGLYRVISLKHIGDTRGDEWYTEMETITQAGMLPGMMLNGSMNPW